MRQERANANIKSTVWRTFGTQMSHNFKTCTTFFNIFSRRCSSHAFLVYLTFSEDFCIPFAFHLTCAQSDLSCTGVTQTHALTPERSETLQKDGAEKRIDLKIHFQ